MYLAYVCLYFINIAAIDLYTYINFLSLFGTGEKSIFVAVFLHFFLSFTCKRKRERERESILVKCVREGCLMSNDFRRIFY